MRRNRLAHDPDYDAHLAHARARERARRPRQTRLSGDPELRAAVQAKLELESSPEQIAGWLRSAFPLLVAWHLCHETICQALHGGRGGLSRTPTRRLRTGRPPRKRRCRPDRRRVSYVIPSKLIDQRPPEVEDRARLGDWEGDLIIGRRGHSAIGTLDERRTRLVRISALPDGHGPERLSAAIAPALEGLPELDRRTDVGPGQ